MLPSPAGRILGSVQYPIFVVGGVGPPAAGGADIAGELGGGRVVICTDPDPSIK